MDLLHAACVPAGDGPFPTIVALHGWGASALDLLGLAPVLHGGRALVLCPQGPVAVPIGPGALGWGWFPLERGVPPDLAEVAKGVAALRSFLDAALETYPIDRRKRVLLGFSQGGVMAYDLALREPDRYAGLAALSSWLRDEGVRSIPRQQAHAALPTLVIHGSEDPMVPVSRGRESRDALLRLGVPVVYREYPMGHEIRPEALRELVGWLDEKVLSPIRPA